MRELYSWFLNAARLGWKFIDAMARSAARWASYPFGVLYNAGLAAYSSFYTGTYLNNNTSDNLDAIFSRSTGKLPALGASPTEMEFVDYFPSIIDGPYSATGLVVSGSVTTGSFNTVDVPMSMSTSASEVINHMQALTAQIDSLMNKNVIDIVITFIRGIPRAIPQW